MRSVKSLAVLSTMALLVIAVPGCDTTNSDVLNSDFVASEDFSFDVDAANQTVLILGDINGEVAISASHEATSVVVTGVKRVGSDSVRDASDFLRQLDVSVRKDGSRVIVDTDQPDDTNGRNCSVDFDVTVPQAFDLVITHINGTVTLRDIEGDTEVTLINGTIEAEMHPRNGGTVDMVLVNGIIGLEIPASVSAVVSAGVTNGSVRVEGIDLVNSHVSPRSVTGTMGTGDGQISLTVVNGDIVITGSEG